MTTLLTIFRLVTVFVVLFILQPPLIVLNYGFSLLGDGLQVIGMFWAKTGLWLNEFCLELLRSVEKTPN